MPQEIKVPSLGQSVARMTVGMWLKQVGDTVAANEAVVELETDWVSLEVTAFRGGKLERIDRQQGASVAVGETLGIIATGSEGVEAAYEEEEEPAEEEERASASQVTLFDQAPFALSQDDTRVVRTRYSTARLFLAIPVGLLAGLLSTNSLQVGAQYAVDDPGFFGWMLWEDHWIIRAAASLVSTVIAAFLAGMVARRKGNVIGTIIVLPACLTWILLAAVGWGLPVLGNYTQYIPIGYRIAGLVLPFLMIPLARSVAAEGASYGANWSQVFDGRRGTLLGIKWFHLFWLPILIHLCLAQSFFAGLYGFEWLKLQWRLGFSITSLVPFLFLFAVFFSLQLMWTGLYSAYQLLSGTLQHQGRRALAVIKFALAYPALAVVIQGVVMGIHYGVSKWLG